MTLAEGMLPQMLMTAGVALGLVVVLRSLRQRMRRHDHDTNLTGAERVERARQNHGMESDLRQMMVELEDLTRRFSAQLDAKSMRLERLLEEADQKIAQLKQLRDAPGIAEDVQANHASAEVPEPVDPLAAEIYRLSDAGKRPRDIARQLDEQVGKVELILNLRQA